MNRDDNTSFTIENLDEQIDHPAEWLSPDDQRLTQDLGRSYQAYEHANAQSLQHVWKRLEQETQKQYMQDTATTQNAPISLLKRKQAMGDRSSLASSSHGNFKRTLSLLAAVIVVALLVGSTAILFNAVGKKGTIHSNTTANNPQPTSTPVVNSSGIYITYPVDSSHTVLSKLDAQTHKPLWVYKTGPSDVGTPVVYGNMVYLNAMDEQSDQAHLIALNAEAGKEIWNVPFKAITMKDENGSGPFDMGVLTTPAVSDGQVFVMNRAGTVFSFAATTGKENWTYNIGTSALYKQYYTDANGQKRLAGSTIYDGGSPIISNGVLYGALQSTYFAVNVKTGKQIWSLHATEPDQLFTSLQIADGVIYTASYIASGHNSAMSLQSYVYAFNAKDGSQIWKYSTKKWVTDAPIFDNGYVYFIESAPDLTFSGDGQSTLQALNSQGKEIWHKDYNANIAGSLTVGEGYISVNANTYDHTNGQILTHTLYVYDAISSKGWEKDVDANPIAIQNGMLYTQVGLQILVYDIKSQKELWHGQYGVDFIDNTGNHSGRLYLVVVVS